MNKSFSYLIFFSLLFNCSTKNDENLASIDFYKNQGTSIILENNSKNLEEEIIKILKMSNYQSFNLQDWKHENYQNSNFIPHSKYQGSLEVKKKKNFFSRVKTNNYEKTILVFNKNIYFVDDLSNIISLDFNLNLIKKFKIYNKKIFQDYLLKFSLASDGKNLFISDNLGNIHSYDYELNKIIWSNKLGVPFVSNLVLYKNNLYVINDNGKIYSFDSKTGSQNWSYESASNIIKNYRAFQVVVENDKLIFSNDLGDLYCVDLLEKKLAWNINTDLNINWTNTNRLLELSKIIIKDGDVFFSTNKKKLFKLNLDNGSINWEINTASESTITSLITPNNLINISNDGFITIIDKITGSILFKKNLLSYFKKIIKNDTEFLCVYSFISSNNLYILTKNGYVFKLDLNNLNNLSYKKITKSISSHPVIISNNIYLFDEDGIIYQLN